MKPWKVISTDGKWTLRQRGEEFLVQVDGRILLSSKRHGSEDELARLATARVSGSGPRVMVGGLGFGFTLRAVLDVLPPGGRVVVAEPSKAVVEWNQGPVGALAEAPLEDPRVTVELGDVQRVLPKHRGGFDVILLDVDQAPFPVSAVAHTNLYDVGGVSSVRASLKPGGRVVFGSSGPQAGFIKRLKEVGFDATAHKTSDGKYFLFVGDA